MGGKEVKALDGVTFKILIRGREKRGEFLDKTQSQKFQRRLWLFFLVKKRLPRYEQIYGLMCRNQLTGNEKDNWSSKVSEGVCFGQS